MLEAPLGNDPGTSREEGGFGAQKSSITFEAELVFALCEARNVEVVLLNQGGESSFEEELVQDVLEIITVFSARMYGSRAHKNTKLVEGPKLLRE